MTLSRLARGPKARERIAFGLLFCVLTATSPIACQSGRQPTSLLEVPIPSSEDMDPEIEEILDEAETDLARALDYVGRDAAERQAEAYGHLAKVLYANYFWSESEPAFENARRLMPKDPRWPYYLGALKEKDGRLDEALADFQASLELDPDNLPARIHEVTILLRLDELERAGPKLDALTRESPNTAFLHELQGDRATAEGNAEAAIEHYLEALRLQPSATALHYKLALAYRDIGDEVQHHAYLEGRGDTGVRLEDPLLEELLFLRRGAQAYLLLGSYLMESGQYEQARSYLERSIESDPDNPVAVNALGRTRLHLNDVEGARQAFEKAIDMAPEDAQSWFNLGMLTYQTTSPEVAEGHLLRAAELAPSDTEIQLGVANFYRIFQRCEMALPYFERAIGEGQGKLLPQLQYILCLNDQERHAEAIERLESLHERMPGEPNVAESLSRMLSTVPEPELRDAERALALAESVFERTPTADAMEAIAMASAALGDLDAARSWQSRAIAVLEESGQAQSLPLHYGEKLNNLQRFEAGEEATSPWPSFLLTSQ